MIQMSKQLVSIIIPTYNEANNIERLLKSIKNQTYQKIESIVVDDASTDETVKLAKKLATKVYPRKHAERSIQRNFGVSKSSGSYVLILDADMELSPKVVEDCMDTIIKSDHKALVIPEKTVGDSFMSRIRSFEREMYIGDATYEVARFFEKKTFNEVGGYDEEITGAEDYDLPYRISKKYTIGRVNEWIYHHETQLTLFKQLKKKYYYAGRSANYAQKHPELVAKQGNMLFRMAYVRNWRKFLVHPFLGFSFIFIRSLEASAAVLGYISVVGFKGFVKTLIKMFNI